MGNGKNNGGRNPFYTIPNNVTDVDSLARFVKANPAIFNILKSTFGINEARHNGTDCKRDSKKILHYAIDNLMWVDNNITIPDIIVQLIQEATEDNQSEIMNRLVHDEKLKKHIIH